MVFSSPQFLFLPAALVAALVWFKSAILLAALAKKMLIAKPLGATADRNSALLHQALPAARLDLQP